MAENKVKCTIVMYHYVRNMPETDYPNIKGLLIKKFIGQLNYLLKQHEIIYLEDYIEFLHGNKTIPNNSCILTFDDGLKDHYANVFPVLKKKKIPATFFPTTQPLAESVVPFVHKVHFLLAKIGSRKFAEEFNQILKIQSPQLFKKFFVDGKSKKEKKYRWDDALTANLKYNIAIMLSELRIDILDRVFNKYFGNEKEFCQKLYMGWEEMKEMIKSGMSFGNHSHTHPMLAKLKQKEQLKELRHSKEILESGLNTKIKSFAYPYGNFNQTIINILKKEGYVCGVTSDFDINEGGGVNPFTLKRLDTNDLPFS